MQEAMHEAAFCQFQRAFPPTQRTAALDELRAREYGRLDATGQVYLDYTGGGLYAASQLAQHQTLLATHVFGNPHSNNPTSQAMTCLIDDARRYVLEYFNAPPDEYVVIFTPNASGALKLVGEAYPFAPGGHYLLTFDNHNSVNGIREFARQQGRGVHLRARRRARTAHRHARARRRAGTRRSPGTPKLFAFPAQSNFSGVQHPLELIAHGPRAGLGRAGGCGGIRAVATGSTWPGWRPDFVPLSFYKMFGYPTGMRRAARPAGGAGQARAALVRGRNDHDFVGAGGRLLPGARARRASRTARSTT